MIPLSDPDIPRRTKPYVNYALIAACGLVFLYELFIGPSGREAFFYRYGLIPKELTSGVDLTRLVGPGGVLDIDSGVPAWVTIFTSMFVHGDIMHFAFNMLFLWVFGDNIEDRLGHVKYLLFYLVAGIIAAWTQVALNPSSDVPMIGASGAIAGVLGGYLLLYPFSQIRTLVILFVIFYIRIPAFILLGFWIILQFVSGLGSLGPHAQAGGTAYWAHVGGFLAGMLMMAVLKVVLMRQAPWTFRRPRRWSRWS